MPNQSSLEILITNLELRGGMYLSPFNYSTLTTYLDGYYQGIKDTGQICEFEVFKEWLELKLGHHCSFRWSWLILNLFSDHDEEKAIKNFFQLFWEFSKYYKEKGYEYINDLNRQLEDLEE